MNPVAIIPARGGSKSIPRKNLVLLNGRPLIDYTLIAALKSKFIPHIIVSTDDSEIREHVLKFCKPLTPEQKSRIKILNRPPTLAEDDTLMKDVLLEVLSHLKQNWEHFILLQPTSPLRTSEDIDSAVQKLSASKCDSLIGVQVKPKTVYKYFKTRADGTLTGMVDGQAPFLNRQAIPEVYGATGALYIFSVQAFLKHQGFPLIKTLPFRMDEKHALDVDTLADLALAEQWIREYS